MHGHQQAGPSRSRDVVETPSRAISETRLRSVDALARSEEVDDPHLRLLDAILSQDQIEEETPEDD